MGERVGKVQQEFVVTFRCPREMPRHRFRQGRVTLNVEAHERVCRVKVTIRPQTAEQVGAALCLLEEKMTATLERELARDLVRRVMGVLKKELAMDESAAMVYAYRHARAARQARPGGMRLVRSQEREEEEGQDPFPPADE